MKCASCGTESPAESTFCPKCGAKSDGPPASEPTPNERFKEAAKSRVDATNDDDEQDLWAGGYSAKAMYGTWLAGGLVTLGSLVGMVFFPPAILVLGAGILVLWVILGCMLAYKKLSVHYELTTQRFIHRSGLLKIVTDRIEVIDIDDVTYEQGIVQRMLNVGKIRISSSDRTHPELVLSGISDVKTVADTIDDIRRKERRRRGLHIEAI